MEKLAKICLIGSIVVLGMALNLSFMSIQFIAGPNGWLDLSLVLAVLSIAFNNFQKKGF